MFVVGPLDNDNGMATWCWEAAHALHRSGQSIVLAISYDANLPGDPEMEVIRLQQTRPSRMKLMRVLEKVFKVVYPIVHPRPDGSLHYLHSELLRLGRKPTIYLLNRTTMVDARVPVPQYVVAWAYPVSLGGYLAKTSVMLQSKHPLARPRMFLWIMGMWREDWRAYRQATGVLAVTDTLCSALVHKGIKAFRVYPATRVSETPSQPVATRRQILMAAATLDEPRKRIGWMLDALTGAEGFNSCELLLVGVASSSIAAALERVPFPTRLLGRLRRDQLQTLMSESDIFCFGSKMDDWGYVVAEAVSNGMIVVAPNQSPFDEIVADTGFMFEPTSSTSFTNSLREAIQLTPEELDNRKNRSKTHAAEVLAYDVFARELSDLAASRKQ